MGREKKKIDITIIIPHFNTPDYLEILLNSIPCVESFQILVIDDNSTKEKEKYLSLKKNEKYQHVTFVDNMTERKGAGACRNIGIEQSKGEWLLFADADDFFARDLFGKLKKYLSSNCDVIFFPLTSIDAETQMESYRHQEINKVMDEYLLQPSFKNELNIRYRLPVPYSKLIKSNLIRENRITFDETLVANDVMFSTRVGFYMKTFELATESIYCITSNPGSLTKMMNEDNYNTRLNVFIDKYTFIKENLSKKDFEVLNLNGKVFIRWNFQYNLGLRKLIWLLKVLRKNDIKIMGSIREIKLVKIVKQFNKIVKQKGEV